MATKRGFSGWRAISKVEESTYDAGATIASTFRNAADPLNVTVELSDGTDLIGTEAEAADEQDILCKRAVGAEALPKLRPNEAALYLAYAFGNLNQSPANEPASSYYTHTITPAAATYTNGAQDGTGAALTSLTVEDTSSWPSAGSFVNAATETAFAYTGKTATTFTGCSMNESIADDALITRLQPDNDYTLPSFSILDYIGAAYKKQFDGCMVQSFEIAADRKGFIRGAAQIVGSGTVSNPSTSRPTELAEVYLKIGDANINIAGTFNGRTFTSGTDINAKVKGFRWSVENDIPDDLVYGVGGGQVRTKAERLRRRQSLQVMFEFEDMTEQAYVTAQTNLNLEINLAGASGSYAVNLYFPQMRFVSSPVSGGTGVLMTSQDAAIQQHATYGSVMAKVINQQVDYLHA